MTSNVDLVKDSETLAAYSKARDLPMDYHISAYSYTKVDMNEEYNRAWNDAIDAAADEAANWWAYLHDDEDRDGPIAESIRALKRTQGHT